MIQTSCFKFPNDRSWEAQIAVEFLPYWNSLQTKESVLQKHLDSLASTAPRNERFAIENEIALIQRESQDILIQIKIGGYTALILTSLLFIGFLIILFLKVYKQSHDQNY